MELILENTILAAFSGLFGTYVIVRLAECFMRQPRKKKHMRILSILACFTVIAVGHYLSYSTIVLLLFYFAAVFVITAGYQDASRSKLMYVVYGMLAVSGIQLLMTMLVRMDTHVLPFDKQILTYIVEYTAALMLGRVSAARQDIPVPKIYWAAIVLVPVSSMYVISLLYKVGSLSTVELVIAAVAILGVDYIIILLYDALAGAYQQSLRQSLLEQQNKYYASQLKSMSEAYNTIRSVKHDISKSLNAIRYLASKNECSKIMDYVDSVNSAPGFNVKYVDTGNGVIDGILNYKRQEAADAGIRMECSVAVMAEMQLDAFDISILLGNLLDNALTAAKAFGDAGYVSVDMKQTMTKLTIRIENPYGHELVYNHRHQLVSTKPDSKEHGIGLENVMRIVKKYEGQMDIYMEDSIFKVIVNIYFDNL